MNRVIKRVKGIAFTSLYIGIYYAVSFVFYNILFLWARIGGTSFSEIEERVLNNSYAVTAAVGIVCLIIYYSIGKLRKQPMESVVERKNVPTIIYAMAVTLAIGCRFLVSVYYSFAQKITVLEKSIEKAAEINPEITTASQLLTALFCVAVFAPFFEEIMFRGLVMTELLKIMRPWAAIGLQAIIFGAIHGVLFQSIFAFVIGIVLGILYYRSQNILVAMTCHSAFNISAVLMQGELSLIGVLVYSVSGLSLCALSLIYIFSNLKKDSRL